MIKSQSGYVICDRGCELPVKYNEIDTHSCVVELKRELEKVEAQNARLKSMNNNGRSSHEAQDAVQYRYSNNQKKGGVCSIL